MSSFTPVLQSISNGGPVAVCYRKIKLFSHITWNNRERALKSTLSFFLLFLRKNSLLLCVELGVAFEWRLLRPAARCY